MGYVEFLIDGQGLNRRFTSPLLSGGFLGWRKASSKSSGLEEGTLQELRDGGEHLEGAKGHLSEQDNHSTWA